MTTTEPALARARFSARYAPWTYAALGLTAIVFVYCGISFYIRALGEGTDFNVFYLGGQLAVESPEQLYEQVAPRGRHYTFISPPMVAVFMAPFAVLPLEVSVILWLALNVGSSLHAAWILTRLLAPAGQTVPFFAATVVTTLAYTAENILLGQLHAVLLYLTVLAFAALRQGRPVAGGAALGAATAIKLLPAVLGLYFLVRRQRRALAGFALAVVLCTVAVPALAMGPRTALALLGSFYELQVAPYVSGEAAQHAIYARTALRKTQHDHDLGAFLMRHFTAEHAMRGYERLVIADLDLRVVRSAMFVLFAGILVISVLAVWPTGQHRRWPPSGTDLGFSLFVVLSMLLSPRSRVAYWTVFMVPTAVLLSRVMGAPTPSGVWRIAAWTLGVSAVLGALAVVPVLPGLSLGFWAQMVLWGGLLLLGRRERADAGLPP